MLDGAYQNSDFVAINPQHTVPCLHDNGKVLTDSHAISTYLVSKYGSIPDGENGDSDTENAVSTASLLPSDPYGRALVDSRLHFNNGTLFSRFSKLCSPVFRGIATNGLDKGHYNCLVEALNILEQFLTADVWVAGGHMTVADLCCVTTVAPIFKMLPVPKINYPRIVDWLDRLQALPYYDEVMYQYLINVNEVYTTKLGDNK